jgi:ankyrin repeat protein
MSSLSSNGIMLFDLIKKHEYSKLINIIKNNNNIDLNEVDETGIYLIQYAILFRQKDIVALLISRNCKLDILDSDGRGIFYIPIKFGYNDIVNILINFSNIVIGIPLLLVQDSKMNIPLHYAIIFKKWDIMNDILKTNLNINYKDIDGNTALHLFINNIGKTDKLDYVDIIDKMLQNNININITNNLGQSILHIAIEKNNIDIIKYLIEKNININGQTTYEHYTPILIATINNYFDICKILLDSNANVENQDIYGNTVLNYAILNKSKELINLYYDKVNINLVNISGQNSINLFFNNDYDLNKLDEYQFRYFLNKSNLNIQNNEGKTTLYYLISNNVWEKYIDILVNKKNKIFIQDINGISPYNLIEKKDKLILNKFIDMIANSFYNSIIAKPELNLYNLDLSSANRQKTITTIKSLIIEKHISYPGKKKAYCKTDLNYNNIKISSYIGISLDIITGLIYIKQKYPNIETSLTENFIENSKLEEYYKMSGLEKNYMAEFLNFEIVWSYQKLFVPSNIKSIIANFLKDDKKRYLVLPIGIELTNGAHANVLLYDKTTNEMERFEPYGKDFPPNFNYISKNLDFNLSNLFKNYFQDLKYYTPSDFEIKIGLQLLDSYEYNKEKHINDPGGFCAAWSLWYVEMRITNSDIDRKDILNKLINQIRLKRLSFKFVIRGFTKNITDLRDNILSVANIDINKWLNDNYDKDAWDKVVNQIIKLIK